MVDPPHEMPNVIVCIQLHIPFVLHSYVISHNVFEEFYIN